MAELGDVIGGDIITSTFTNQVKDRTVMRYANAAARDASVLTPVSGDLAWLIAEQVVTVYSGTSWSTLVTASTEASSGFSGTLSAIVGGYQPTGATFNFRAGGLYVVTCSGFMNVSTGAARPEFRAGALNAAQVEQYYTITKAAGSDAVMPFSFTYTQTYAANDGLYLAIQRNDVTGTQLFTQCSIVAQRAG